jgi:hypothetical protein
MRIASFRKKCNRRISSAPATTTTRGDENDFGERQLSSRYMLLAFEKLPKLRHFEFSDYRALARNGEALHELCTRLFGQTCTPELLPHNEPRESLDVRGWNSLPGCLRNLLHIHPRLDSFSIGRGNLKAWGEVFKQPNPSEQFGSEFLGDDGQWLKLFGSIQSISLPVEFGFMDEVVFEESTGIVQNIRITAQPLSSSWISKQAFTRGFNSKNGPITRKLSPPSAR